jgi:predicted nucleic acid-binding protein
MANLVDRFVLDASIAVKWQLTDEEYWDQAFDLITRYAQGTIELVAPEHFRYEVPNAVTVASQGRRPRITPEQAARSVDEFLRLAVPTVADDELIRRAAELARVHGCAFYDGLYVALALRLSIPLITADDKLYRLFSHLGAIVWIEDYNGPR